MSTVFGRKIGKKKMMSRRNKIKKRGIKVNKDRIHQTYVPMYHISLFFHFSILFNFNS